MNYRHAFHAGNFADVFKHAVLCRVLMHLREKPAPFRVLDTHAGAGLYDLAGAEADKTGEWRDGIAWLRGGPLAPPLADLLAPYLDAVAALNDADRLSHYPGSPALVHAWLRPQDKLVACELEPSAARALKRHLRGDMRIKMPAVDGWTALNAYLPPPERRGLVLIDPPYEDAGDFRRLPRALSDAHRKWATGIYLVWYPIKDRADPDSLAKALRRTGIGRILRAELRVAPLSDPTRLNGCGIVLVNPPWTLEAQLSVLLPELAGLLARGKSGFALDWLAGEAADGRARRG